MARQVKKIGLQNRLDIIIQAILDFRGEGGAIQISIEEHYLQIAIEKVVEQDGRFFIREDLDADETLPLASG